MTTASGAFDGSHEAEARRGVAELELFLIAQSPPAPACAAPVPATASVQAEAGLEPGETDAVRALEDEVAEGTRLRELYARRYALNLDTPRVVRRTLRGQEAEKLHALTQNPAIRALQAARALRLFTTAGLFALVLALGWSTVNVHSFAAAGAPRWSTGWVAGWFVEPFLSVALLTIVGAKAFFATRGQQIASATLDKVEWLFLSVTLLMNIYPTLPAPVGPAADFHLPALVLHSLGPVVAVSIVRALPILWAHFAQLDHGADRATGSPHRLSYRENTAAAGDRLAALTAQARELIGKGELPRNPSANAIRKALECGTDRAREIRDQLERGA